MPTISKPVSPGATVDMASPTADAPAVVSNKAPRRLHRSEMMPSGNWSSAPPRMPMAMKLAMPATSSPISPPYTGPTMRKALVVSPIAKMPMLASGEMDQTDFRSNDTWFGRSGSALRDRPMGTSDRHMRMAVRQKISNPAMPMTGMRSWEPVTALRSTSRYTLSTRPRSAFAQLALSQLSMTVKRPAIEKPKARRPSTQNVGSMKIASASVVAAASAASEANTRTWPTALIKRVACTVPSRNPTK